MASQTDRSKVPDSKDLTAVYLFIVSDSIDEKAIRRKDGNVLI